MKELKDFIQQIKNKARRHVQNPREPVGYWSEDDRILGVKTRSFVIILRTSGCRWSRYSGCTMCGYFNNSLDRPVKEDELLAQIKYVFSRYNGEEAIKIFTSGSFLDDEEMPNKLQIEILKRCAEQGNVKKISVESRPEFVEEEKIRRLKEAVEPAKFEVSIGLESANNLVLQYAVNKGFKFKDYREAVDVLKKENVLVKTYVLIKPPFLTEYEAIKDSVETVEKIKDATDTVSFNPVSVHKNTLVEYLWKRGEYRPPWLWSVVDILRRSKVVAPNVEIKCDITGGGTQRGAHNCGGCDRVMLDAIHRFSLEQDVDIFQVLECGCKETWQDYLDLETFSFGSLVVEYEKSG